MPRFAPPADSGNGRNSYEQVIAVLREPTRRPDHRPARNAAHLYLTRGSHDRQRGQSINERRSISTDSRLPRTITVSGRVYDVTTGLLTTVVPATAMPAA
jgi:hypothetical protein